MTSSTVTGSADLDVLHVIPMSGHGLGDDFRLFARARSVPRVRRRQPPQPGAGQDAVVAVDAAECGLRVRGEQPP